MWCSKKNLHVKMNGDLLGWAVMLAQLAAHQWVDACFLLHGYADKKKKIVRKSAQYGIYRLSWVTWSWILERDWTVGIPDLFSWRTSKLYIRNTEYPNPPSMHTHTHTPIKRMTVFVRGQTRRHADTSRLLGKKRLCSAINRKEWNNKIKANPFWAHKEVNCIETNSDYARLTN